MTSKNQPSEILAFLRGRIPGLKTIYEKIKTPGSGIKYLINIHSVQDELATLQKALDQESNEYIKRLIKQHHDTISGYIPGLKFIDIINPYCYKLPVPIPPPPPPPFLPSINYICFFTRSVWSKVEFYKNEKLLAVLKRDKFIDLTKTYIVRMPKEIPVKKGDILMLKLPVEYFDRANNIIREIVEYKEIFKKNLEQKE